MKQTIKQIVTSNIEAAIDQKHEYDCQADSVSQWWEGDAYLASTVDSIREAGYTTESDWEDATGLFCKLAEEAGLRFTN
jgi:hypothetical protein